MANEEHDIRRRAEILDEALALVRAMWSGSPVVRDGATYQVDSTWGWSSWYGRFAGVPKSIRSLSITYTGSTSAECNQALVVYNTTYGVWLSVDTRTVGSTPVTTTATVGGTVSSYVSDTGDVLVGVQCISPYGSPFYVSGDLLQITYGT
jgi:hypothetical protein